VAGTIAWLAIVAAGIAWEIACRFGRLGRTGWPPLGRVLGDLDRRLPGRLLLLLAWAFAGLHLFARYTVPR
jgi:ABC-type nitrate/sulfonate/bicarbonate transport system permease component